MSYSKTIPMHKRMAAGETLTGMKKGGAADCAKPMKKGGAVKGKGNPFAKKGKEC
jgi:hypothetical protein